MLTDESNVGSEVRRRFWYQLRECTRQAILNSTRLWTDSQCSWRDTGMMWSRRPVLVSRRAAEFSTDWTFLAGSPSHHTTASCTSPVFRRQAINAWTILIAASEVSDQIVVQPHCFGGFHGPRASNMPKVNLFNALLNSDSYRCNTLCLKNNAVSVLLVLNNFTKRWRMTKFNHLESIFRVHTSSPTNNIDICFPLISWSTHSSETFLIIFLLMTSDARRNECLAWWL